MPRILVIEDEEHIAQGLQFNLEAEGHEVDIEPDGARGAARLEDPQNDYHLVLLDLMLPGMSGFEVARRSRAAGNYVPILILTAKDDSQDLVRGLEEGADDYLCKPFQLEELLARVRGLLRRRRWDGVSEPPDGPGEVRIGNATVHFDRFELETPDETVSLTTREAGLLRALVEREGGAVTRGELLEEVWGLRPDTRTRVVDNFIVRLRRYLEDDPSRPRHIVSVRGHGYRLVAERGAPARFPSQRGFPRLCAHPRPCNLDGVEDPLKLSVLPDLRDASLLLAFEGWNDAGSAASSAVRFIERSIQTVPLAEIDGEEFYDFTVSRPGVALREDRRVIEWPNPTFGYGSVDPTRELVTGCGHEPHMRWRSFCDACVRMVRQLGLNRVILLGAYLADVVYSRPVGVTGYASDPAVLDRIGVPLSAYEGPTGIVGVLGESLRGAGFEIVSLWAGLPHYITATPNPRGALALVQTVAELLDLKLDTSGLAGEAAAFEEQVNQLVAADPELGEYVRQLKKREFAQ